MFSASIDNVLRTINTKVVDISECKNASRQFGDFEDGKDFCTGNGQNKSSGICMVKTNLQLRSRNLQKYNSAV
jgi:hypothetical protein